MAVKTFKRLELKYMVTPEQYDIITEALGAYMRPDRYCKNGGNYTVYNIYFDTINDDIIRKSIAKPYYKEKLRLRSYRMPTSGEDTVFLELKKKIGGIVTKRRAVMSYQEAMRFTGCGIPPAADNYQDRQVISEISDFLCRYSVLPKVYISYDRVAYFGKDDPELRVSFDRNILTRREQVNLVDGDYGSELLLDDRYLMEIKCLGAMPLWLCHLLSSLEVYKTSFSKYGTEFTQHIQNRTISA